MRTSVIAMAKERPEKIETSALKVDQAEHELVTQLAAMRRLSVWELFKEPDVREFFSHLLIAEMAARTKALTESEEAKRPPAKPKR